jgi:hypothetical protein
MISLDPIPNLWVFIWIFKGVLDPLELEVIKLVVCKNRTSASTWIGIDGEKLDAVWFAPFTAGSFDAVGNFDPCCSATDDHIGANALRLLILLDAVSAWTEILQELFLEVPA